MVGLILRRLVAPVTLVLALGLLSACVTSPAEKASGKTPPVEVRISAATSLKKAFEAMAPAYEKRTNTKLVFNFGASGALQKQIEGGAPADVFASASPKQIDALIGRSFVLAGETATFASNTLVIVTPRGNPKGIEGLLALSGAERLVTGNPETAPHGTKAKDWLEGKGAWEPLQSKFVFAENAAQTLDYVARGEVDAGIVFGSEAFGRDDVEVVYTVPEAEITPISYVVAPVQGAEQSEPARAFIAFLLSDEGQQVLLENGFKKWTPASQ